MHHLEVAGLLLRAGVAEAVGRIFRHVAAPDRGQERAILQAQHARQHQDRRMRLQRCGRPGGAEPAQLRQRLRRHRRRLHPLQHARDAMAGIEHEQSDGRRGREGIDAVALEDVGAGVGEDREGQREAIMRRCVRLDALPADREQSRLRCGQLRANAERDQARLVQHRAEQQQDRLAGQPVGAGGGMISGVIGRMNNGRGVAGIEQARRRRPQQRRVRRDDGHGSQAPIPTSPIGIPALTIDLRAGRSNPLVRWPPNC